VHWLVLIIFVNHITMLGMNGMKMLLCYHHQARTGLRQSLFWGIERRRFHLVNTG